MTKLPVSLLVSMGQSCGVVVGWRIDNAVYLIAYVFSGGPEPAPYYAGDSDCTSGVNIDNVVFLIDFIFSGGSAPCDPNGDGVPDC